MSRQCIRMTFSWRRTIIFLVLCLHALRFYGEGSKQVYIGTQNVNFYLCNDFTNKCNNGNGDRTQFAIYDCNEVDRLYFDKVNATEVIYLGFQGSGQGILNHIVFRIKDMTGAVVYPTSGGEMNLPTAVPAGQTGYISTIDQARNGPNQIPGTTNGYTAINFHPSATGRFYIEFNRKNNSGNVSVGSFNLDLIDITVFDTVALQAKPGRLFSKAWQFQTSNTGGGGYSGTNYIYSVDSIITSAQFNTMLGGTWVQFCNQWGCANTGNFANDRKSLHDQSAFLPSFPIFLNPPDAALWHPAVILGSIVGTPWYEQFCSGQITFHVNVNKAGNVAITLGFGPPYTNRVLTTSVTTGENLITWDGFDGSATPLPVPNNVPITLSVTYINGLTNLPLYDVETNDNGFIIGLYSPSGPTPLVYWDDSNIQPGGIVNLTGCLSPPGCHSWPNNWGNLNTINTWWYTVSSTTAMTSTVEWRSPQPLTFVQQPPQNICAGTSNLTFSVTPDPNTQVYHWNYTGTGATITQVNPSDAAITISFANNATSGNLEVYGTNTNCNTTPSPTISLPITIKPLPDLTTSLTYGTCSGVGFTIPLTSNPPGATFSWTSPVPTCSANIVSCPPGSTGGAISDNLSVSNTSQGSVTYHITPTLNLCNGVMKDLVVTVDPLPTASSSPVSPSTLCSGQTTAITLTSNFPTTTFSWSAPVCTNILTPPGAGSGATIADQLQLTSNSMPGSAVYTIIPSNGGCTGPSIQHTVNVNPVPVPSITGSLNFSVCAGASETYATEASMTNYVWTVSSGGTINSGQFTNSINVTWNTVGPQTVQVTYTNTYNCNPVSPTIQNVTVKPIPNVITSPASPQTICSGTNAQVSLSSNVPGTETITTFAWTATGNGATITPNPSTISGSGNISQNLANSGNILEPVIFHIMPTANGCSPASTVNFTFNVNPVPVVTTSPGTEQDLCSGTLTAAISLQTNVTGLTPSYNWNSVCDPGISGCPPASGTSNPIASFLPLNSTISQKNVTFTILASLPGSSVTCYGPQKIYIVKVEPLPVSTFTGQTTVCQLNPSPYLYTADAGPACSYTWSVNPASAGTIANAAVSPASVTWNTPGGATLALSAVTTFGCSTSSSQPIVINPRPDVSITPCFDVVTNRSAKQFLLKGGRPLLTTTPLQGEYIITPATPALTSDVAGNFWFNPALVPGTNTVTFSLSYKYTSSQFGCPATSPTSVTLTVRAANPPCGTSMTDYRDNTTYRTSFVAGRCWMMENLRYGTPLSPITTAQTDNCTTEKYCLASDATCTTYGGLYQWDELIQYGITAGPEYQGVCPAGWHIPTAADYQALIDANQGNGIAGAFLIDLNLNPRGFEALIRGMAYLNTAWAFTSLDIPSGTLFWTSTPGSGTRIITRGMNSKVQSVQYYEAIKADAFPVRCVKD